MQDELMKRYNEKWSADDKKRVAKQSVQYSAPSGSDEHLDHFTNFFEGIRNNKPVIEDPIVGFVQRLRVLQLMIVTFRKKLLIGILRRCNLPQYDSALN
jgi:hypothetical protein